MDRSYKTEARDGRTCSMDKWVNEQMNEQASEWGGPKDANDLWMWSQMNGMVMQQ